MRYTELVKWAAKTHYDKRPGHPTDVVIDTQYYSPYFSDFGAGSRANAILREDFDQQLDDLTAQEDQTGPFTEVGKRNPKAGVKEQEELTNQIVNVRDRRHARENELSLMIDKANLGGLGLGTLAGVGGAGLTYAGLSLIPSLKQKKVRRAVLALLAGLPIGYITADKSGKWLFDRMNQRSG